MGEQLSTGGKHRGTLPHLTDGLPLVSAAQGSKEAVAHGHKEAAALGCKGAASAVQEHKEAAVAHTDKRAGGMASETQPLPAIQVGSAAPPAGQARSGHDWAAISLVESEMKAMKTLKPRKKE